jgi:hypothetical protein
MLRPCGGNRASTVRDCSPQKPSTQGNRSQAMGDKGGKKDKNKGEKQKVAKKEQENKKKQEKQPKKSP